MAKYQINLVEQFGENYDPILQATVKRSMGQYSIMLGGEIFKDSARKEIEIGLVAKEPGLPINFLPPANAFGKEDIEFFASEVKRQLDKINGVVSERKVFDPPSLEDIEAQNELLASAADGETTGEDESL